MIRSFRCKETALIFRLERSRKFPSDIQQVVLRKLRMIDRAISLADLKIPPANRLEKLHADRRGQWSIRVNDQWRLCFEWQNGDVYNLELVDYH